MSTVPQEHIDQMRTIIKDVLGSAASEVFLQRLDRIINDWASGAISAALACEKVQKLVALFIDEQKAREIGFRCAPIVMKESTPSHG